MPCEEHLNSELLCSHVTQDGHLKKSLLKVQARNGAGHDKDG